MMRLLLLCLILLFPSLTQAATFYISPSGNNGTPNDGTSTSQPWLTFPYALDPTRASCGDTLLLMDGLYGDGTSTGKIDLNARVCTAGAPLTIQAINERQARIHDSGVHRAVYIRGGSAYIDVRGLHLSSTNNSANRSPGQGNPLQISSSNNIRLFRVLARNPNKYGNNNVIEILDSTNITVEQLECYDFHRHCVDAFMGENVVVDLSYANNRLGMITGGYANGSNTVGASDALMAMYPCRNCLLLSSIAEGANNGMRMTEMNATFANSILMSGSKVMGNICLGCKAGNAIYPNSRPGTGTNFVPQDLLIENNAIVDSASISAAIQCADCLRVVINKNTSISSHASGIITSDITGRGIAASAMNTTITNNIVKSNSGVGFSIASGQTIWTGANNFSNGNGDNYNPNLPSNWSTGTASVETDPGLGTCKVWTPDGSAAKLAGAGANVLYRYDSLGNETTTQLWNQSTGEFPRGATVAGINDVAGSSLFDVHERLNINTNGCDFPSGYVTGGGPAAADAATGEGTTSVSFTHTFPVDTDAALLGIAIRSDSGSVGTVSAASVGGSAASVITGTDCTTADGTRRSILYQRTAALSGEATVAVTTTGTVSGLVVTSLALPDADSFNTGACATGLSSTPSVTAVTNTGETVVDHLATASAATVSEGADQTLALNTAHTTKSLRSAMSTQSGDDGGVMSHTLNASYYWAQSTVSVVPNTPDPPADECTITQVAGRVDGAFLVNGSVSPLGDVNDASTSVPAGTSFAVTLQTDATDAACPTAGRKLYVSYNGGAYVPVTDTLTNNLSFHGVTSDPLVVSGAVSTNLSGVLDNIAGTTIHSVNVNTSATMTENSSLVNRWVVKLGPDAEADDTYEFREYTDAGVALNGTYGATADAKVTVTGSSPDITAPTGLKSSGIASNVTITLTWSPVTYTNLAGYKVYQSTESGVYGLPVATITPTSAALLNTSVTSYTTTLYVGDTYYFVVTAFDLDGNESAASSEVSVVLAGFTARSASAGGAATARDPSTGRAPRGEQAP